MNHVIVMIASTVVGQSCPGPPPSAGCNAFGSLLSLKVDGSELYYLLGPGATVPPNGTLRVSGGFNMGPLPNAQNCCQLTDWIMTVTWPDGSSSNCAPEYHCTTFPDCYEWCDPGLHTECLMPVDLTWAAPMTLFPIDIDSEHVDACWGGGSAGHGYLAQIDPNLPNPTPGDFDLDGDVDVDDLLKALGVPYWNINGVDGLLEVILNWD